MASREEALHDLATLLGGLFDGDSLLRFLEFRPGGQQLVAQLNPLWSPRVLTMAAVTQLERQRAIDVSLFAALTQEFPRRSGEIERVCAQLRYGPSTAPSASESLPGAFKRGAILGVVELEVALEREAQGGLASTEMFMAQLRVCRPGEADEQSTIHGLRLDRETLRIADQDPARQGAVLGRFLFGSPEIRASFGRIRDTAEILRLRLMFGPTACDLQELQWEALRDPDREDLPLVLDTRIYFFRYLNRAEWRPVRLRPRAALRALAIPEAPAAVTLRDELGAGAVTTLATADVAARLIPLLREGPDVLCLTGRCRLDEHGRPCMKISGEGDDGAEISGIEWVHVLTQLDQCPRLVVLVAAPGGQDGALLSLAAQMVEAGIAAALVVQARVVGFGVAALVATFLRELLRDGLVDRAVAAGRRALDGPEQASEVVLLSRLRRGKIWYDAGFGAGGLGNWDAIRVKIEDGECTPIIGPGLFESLFELRPWLARQWAQEYVFPLAASQREDLPAVAQYLASRQGPDFPHRRLVRDLPLALRERLSLANDGGAGQTLVELLSALRAQRFNGRADPYRILADLPLRVFLFGCHDPLFVQVLRERGKRPQVGVVPWRRAVRDPLPRGFQPTVEEPLVYFLFGSVDTPRSLVLTQDDYVDFLLNIQKPDVREAIPKVILASLVDTSLLFLGFQIDSWEFRVVFRTVMQQEGMESSRGPHVAAQIEPEEGRVIDPARARTYFERYLSAEQIDIYWGTPEGFLADLVGYIGGGQA